MGLASHYWANEWMLVLLYIPRLFTNMIVGRIASVVQSGWVFVEIL